jgi:hypothetical protein
MGRMASKRWEKPVHWLLLLPLMLTTGLPARANDSQKKAAKVIEQSLSAQGGTARLAGPTSISFQGTLTTGPAASAGTFTLIGKSANQMYEELNSCSGPFSQGSNGISL